MKLPSLRASLIVPACISVTLAVKPFTVTIGSVMECSHVPLHKWALAFRLMASSKKGVSAHHLMRSLALAPTARPGSWRIASARPWPIAILSRWAARARRSRLTRLSSASPISTFVNGKGWQGKRGTATKRKVLTMVERGGRAVSDQGGRFDGSDASRPSSASMSCWIATLNTDEAQFYKPIGKSFSRTRGRQPRLRRIRTRRDDDEHRRRVLRHLQARHDRRVPALRREPFTGVSKRV